MAAVWCFITSDLKQQTGKSPDYSGTTVPPESIWIDGETSRFTALLRYGLFENLEAGIDIPLIHHDGGFSDKLISNFHNLFNFSPLGRDLVAPNQLNYLPLNNL
jgi:hypothetical protein